MALSLKIIFFYLLFSVKDNLFDLQQIKLDAERRVKTSKVLLADIEKVALSRGFKVSDNPESGNCMFYALSEQLELVKGIKIRHENLRKTLVQFLKENPELVSLSHSRLEASFHW